MRTAFPARLTSSIALLICSALPAAAQRGPATVEVAELQQATVALKQTFLGTVTPPRRSTVGSAVAGRVERMQVDVGQLVTLDEKGLGKPLALLRTKTIQIEIAAAKAELRLRQREAEELENGSRPEEIQQAEARRDAAKALWEFAEQRYARVKLLLTRKGASQDEVDEALSQQLATNRAYLAAKLGYELLKKGPRKEKIAQAKARVAVAEEEVNRLEDRLKKYTLRAPFRGFVTAKHVEVGDWVQQGDPVVEVVELDPIEILTPIPEDAIAYLQRKTKARLVVDALPAKQLEVELHKIVPQADNRARTFPVYFRLHKNPYDPQRGHLLKAGMLARITLPIRRTKAALLAPKDALILNQNVRGVMVITKDAKSGQQTARMVPVRLGVVDQSRIEIIDSSGTLKAGMQVVTRGNERLRPGQPVRIIATTRVSEANKIKRD